MSIWKYHKYFKHNVNKSFRLTCKEGNTPCIQCKSLAKTLGLEKLYLKDEQTNPTGSFKDRSLAFQLSAHYQTGRNEFVISSSGNAAISAVCYCKLFECKLTVFVSAKIPKDKFNRLLKQVGIKNFDYNQIRNEESISSKNITINFSDKPRSEAIKFQNTTNALNLRGSTDDLAIEGFKTIAYELLKQTESIDAIFIPCSSGTSTLGIFRGFSDLNRKCPSIHIVQTTKVHPMAKKFDKKFTKAKSSLASAIVDRVAHRKEEVIEILQNTKGFGWIICDKEIKQAQNMLQKRCNIKASEDAALSLAGLIKALKNNFEIKRPVLMLSGK